jgi:hypothetical protein
MAEVKDGMGSQGQGLAKLREAFPAHQISQRAQSRGGPMLPYVGHAALTDRLLDADPMWNWAPLAFGPEGLPVLDKLGGMWIRLTVCGVTRLGYGDAGEKIGPNAIKEVIGDALRNAAMRFGAALDLWHKGELHIDPPTPEPKGVVAAVVDSLPPLSDGDREFFDTLAHDVAQTFLNLGPMKALERVMMEKLEAEQRIHLEQRLDSKVRAGLKQAGDLKRAEKTRAKA